MMKLLSANGKVHRVTSAASAASLGAYLLDPARQTPVVVVSVHPSMRRPFLPVEQIAQELVGTAPVVLLPSAATYALTDALGGQRRSVFFGAGRVYPIGTRWVLDETAAPLHMCWLRTAPGPVAAAIVADALEAAGAGAHPNGGSDLHDVDQLLVEVEELRAALLSEREQRRRAVEEARDLRAKLRIRADAAPVPVREDQAEQLRHEIALAYLARIPQSGRADLPLVTDFEFGPAFLPSLGSLDGVSRGKVVDVLVEVLTGLDRTLAGRARRPWRDGRGGAQAVRADGGRAWRVNLQTRTPGARRLKFWTLDGGRVEFDVIAHHDDGLH